MHVNSPRGPVQSSTFFHPCVDRVKGSGCLVATDYMVIPPSIRFATTTLSAVKWETRLETTWVVPSLSLEACSNLIICKERSPSAINRVAIACARSAGAGVFFHSKSEVTRDQSDLPASDAAPFAQSVARTVSADVIVASAIWSITGSSKQWDLAAGSLLATFYSCTYCHATTCGRRILPMVPRAAWIVRPQGLHFAG